MRCLSSFDCGNNAEIMLIFSNEVGGPLDACSFSCLECYFKQVREETEEGIGGLVQIVPWKSIPMHEQEEHEAMVAKNENLIREPLR